MTRIVDRFRLTPFISLLYQLGRFVQCDWHCKGDKEGKKEKKEKEGREDGESFVQSNVQFSSTYPLFNRKGRKVC